MDLGIKERVALVTASSKGLGRGAALALGEEGAFLVVNARNKDTLEETTAELERRGVPVLAVPGDLSDPEVPSMLVRAAVGHFGKLDIVVANNGGPPPGRALDATDDAIRAAVEANLLSAVRLVRSSLPGMRERRWGRICCISSFSIVQPLGGLALSNTARTGLWAWAKTAANDLMGSGVTLNLACPGMHLSDRVRALGMTDRVYGDPDDFGRVVAFLCSEPANYVNGAAVVVDGGETLAL